MEKDLSYQELNIKQQKVQVYQLCLLVRVVMDWILEYPIQIQICGLDFKSKSIFFYESNLESKFKYLDWILNPNPYFL